MKYDFTSIIDRKGKDAIAVDGVGKIPGFAPDAPMEGFDLIPMWVADMNFPVAPSITEALTQRISHPTYGYYNPKEEYYDAIIHWHRERNDVIGLKKEHIGYENGVLGGVISALNVLCSKGDHILIHRPTYIGFSNSVKNNGYHLVHSDLVLDKDQVYRMNLADMEEKIKKYHIHTAIFCSPHNPCGRVWERQELEEMMELFAKYDVYVICDEIWSDIIRPEFKHIPLQSINEDARMRTIALYAPSKTFNLAGLIGSYHIIYNKWLKDRIDKEASLCHYNSMNVLSMHALIGAYGSEGQIWADELCQTLAGNLDYALNYIREHFEGVKVSAPQGTYMLFVDCTDWCNQHGKTLEELESAAWKVGVAVQDGKMFHGPCHIRMNLASPLSRIQEAFERLDRYVFHAE